MKPVATGSSKRRGRKGNVQRSRVRLHRSRPLHVCRQYHGSFSGNIVQSDISIISPGDRFNGSFTYTIPSSQLFFPNDNLYILNQFSDSLSIKVHGYTFSAGPGSGLLMAVRDAPSVASLTKDQILVYGNSYRGESVLTTDYPTGNLTCSEISAQIYGDPTFLQSSALPSPFNANAILFGENGRDLTAIAVVLTNGTSYPNSFIGFITAADANDTPEPRTVILCFAGLLGVWVKNRSRHVLAFGSAGVRKCTCPQC